MTHNDIKCNPNVVGDIQYDYILTHKYDGPYESEGFEITGYTCYLCGGYDKYYCLITSKGQDVTYSRVLTDEMKQDIICLCCSCTPNELDNVKCCGFRYFSIKESYVDKQGMFTDGEDDVDRTHLHPTALKIYKIWKDSHSLIA